jgi:dimethylamine/trimethylamine dehydrogenase
VLVYDCDGYFTAVGIAEKLAREGRQITYVTPFESMAPYTRLTFEAPWLNRTLRSLGVTIATEQVVAGITAGCTVTANVWNADAHTEWNVDSVVLVTQRNADDGLYRELRDDPNMLARAGISGLYAVGDCVVPQAVADAVFSGHRLAREIDLADPATARPYIRERRLLGSTDADYVLEGAAAANTSAGGTG